jgi:hypothetical protein
MTDKRILAENVKSYSIPVLAYIDHQNTDGSTYRAFFETSVEFTVWAQEPYQGDTLTVFQSNRPKIGNFIRVYLKHNIGDPDLGCSVQELDFHTNHDGLTVKKTKNIEITQEEFTQKWNSGTYRFLKLDGGVLVQPPIAEYSMVA